MKITARPKFTRAPCPRLEHFQLYQVRVRLRPKHAGHPVKPRCWLLEGQVLTVEVLWLQSFRDRYPGEWALGLLDNCGAPAGVLWISSGDVKVLRQVPRSNLK